jgi:hypothetical protein
VKKKKPLSSKGWSAERKEAEQKYAQSLFEMVIPTHLDEKARF